MVDDTVQVPSEYVKDGEIVLNVSFDATSSLKLGNDFIEFKARFGGKPRDIMVPMDRVMAIYARENGQGMAFPVNRAERPAQPVEAVKTVEASSAGLAAVPVASKADETDVSPTPNPATRPTLTRIK
jgi:stringent starvation protein B